MATDGYTFAAIIMGVVLILSFVAMKLARRRDAPELTDVLALFLSGLAILAAVKLCWMSVAGDSLVPVQNERPYIFMAGIALIWMAVATVYRIFEKATPTRRLRKRGTAIGTNAQRRNEQMARADEHGENQEEGREATATETDAQRRKEQTAPRGEHRENQEEGGGETTEGTNAERTNEETAQADEDGENQQEGREEP